MTGRAALAGTATITAASAAAVVAVRDAWNLPVAAVLGTVLAVAVVAALLVVHGIETVAVGVLALAVGSSPWNAVSFGGVKPAPTLLALSLLALGALAVTRRRRVVVPVWVWPLGGTIVAVAALHLVWPTSVSYLAARFVSGFSFSASDLAAADVTSAITGAQWFVAVVALPVAVCLACEHRPALPLLLTDVWIVGAAVSGFVAVTDELGLTEVSASLLEAVDIGGRQAGLTAQPNHLAMAAALTLPLALWRALRGGRAMLMVACAAALAGSLIVSESRGGLVIAVLACLTVLLADRRARGALPVLGGLGLAGGVIVVASVPTLLTGLAERLRLSGADSAAESDAIREQIGLQALRDFLHDPVRGIGLEVVEQGHNIYLQLLASGGLLLLAGFVLAFAGFFLDARTLRPITGDLSAALALCAAAWLVVGIVENQLTDLYLYVPFALVAGLRTSAPTAGAVPLPTAIVSARR